MSTILKALRRLELEKSAQDGRPLKDEVTAAPDTGSRRGISLLALMIAAGALGLGLGSSLLWFWPREDAASELAEAARAAPPAAVAAAQPPPAPVVAAPQMAAPAPEVIAPAPQIAAPAPSVASAPPPPAEAYASPVEVISLPEPAPAAEPSPESIEPAEQRPPPRGSEPPFARRRKTAAAESPAALPAEVIARIEKPAPPAASAVEPAPPEVPGLLVSSTVWHPQRDRRLAMVSLEGGPARELHEGDAIGSLVVSEIGPSSVLFLNDGAPLRRRVGARN